MNLKEVVQEMVSEKTQLGYNKLYIFSTTEDPASKVYMKKKKELVEKNGGLCEIVSFDPSLSAKEMIAQMDKKVEDIYEYSRTAIIVQFPVAHPEVEEWVYNNLNPDYDIDGLTNKQVANLQRFKTRTIGEIEEFPFFVPATALGVYKLICKQKPLGGTVSIVGRSMLVGLPLFQMLRNDGRYDVKIYDSRNGTGFLNADIVVLARGVQMSGYELAELADLIKNGKLPMLVDVSILRDHDGKLCGEIPKSLYPALEDSGVDFTPVPGGVGLLTTHFLVEQLAKMK